MSRRWRQRQGEDGTHSPHRGDQTRVKMSRFYRVFRCTGEGAATPVGERLARRERGVQEGRNISSLEAHTARNRRKIPDE
jgi:hypothetical protein